MVQEDAFYSEKLNATIINSKLNKIDMKIEADGANYMMISNSIGFYRARWEIYNELKIGWEFAENQDGEHNIYVIFRDKAGNVSGITSDRIIIDTRPPFDTKILIDNGKPYTIHKDGQVKLGIFARGATQMMLSNNLAFSNTQWEPYNIEKSWTLLEGDGVRKVYIKYKDIANNQTQAILDSIMVDRKPPTNCLIEINKGEKKTNHPDKIVIVKVRSKDARLVQISSDSTFFGTRWEGYSERNLKYSLPGNDGKKTLYARFRDEAGNISGVFSQQIILDRTPPLSGKVVINDGEKITNNTNKSVMINLEAKDAKQMLISNNIDFENAEWESFSQTKNWILYGTDGLKTVYVRFRDELGNISRMVYDRIGVDRQAPEGGKIFLNRGKKYCTDINAYTDVWLSARGAKEMAISQDKNFKDSEWIPYTHVIEDYILIGEDGEKQVFAKFRDNADNETLPIVASVILDKQEPFEASVLINDGAMYTNANDGKVVLQIAAQEADEMLISNSKRFRTSAKWLPYQEGAMEWHLSINDGKHSVYVKFRDKAGNESDIAQDDIILDTKAPAILLFQINNNATATDSRNVTLEIKANDAKYMMVANTSNFDNATWEQYKKKKQWQLTPLEGFKRVFIKFKDEVGNISANRWREITLYNKQ